METALRFCGYVGAVLVVFGVLGAVLVGSFVQQPLLVLHLVLGILCLVVWGLTSGLASVSKSIGYFLSLILVGLFVSHRALEAQRWR